MKNYKIQTLSPLAHTPMLLTSDFPLKGGEPVTDHNTILAIPSEFGRCSRRIQYDRASALEASVYDDNKRGWTE